MTTVELPSIHPQFIVITMFEEATLDRLMTGPVNAELYHMCLEPERLDPDATLVPIPDSLIAVEASNADNVIQALREDALVRYHQMTLVGILHSHHVDTSTVLDALAAWFRDTELG